jgi:hypothetical protein
MAAVRPQRVDLGGRPRFVALRERIVLAIEWRRREGLELASRATRSGPGDDCASSAQWVDAKLGHRVLE